MICFLQIIDYIMKYLFKNFPKEHVCEFKVEVCLDLTGTIGIKY